MITTHAQSASAVHMSHTQQSQLTWAECLAQSTSILQPSDVPTSRIDPQGATAGGHITETTPQGTAAQQTYPQSCVFLDHEPEEVLHIS